MKINATLALEICWFSTEVACAHSRRKIPGVFVILLIAHLKQFTDINRMWVSSCTSFLWINPELRSLFSDKDLSPSNLGLPLSNKNSLLAVWNLHIRLARKERCTMWVACQGKAADCVYMRAVISFKNSSTLDQALHPRAAAPPTSP
jgi:hypothetical protein